jgi:hypothetical protein
MKQKGGMQRDSVALRCWVSLLVDEGMCGEGEAHFLIKHVHLL